MKNGNAIERVKVPHQTGFSALYKKALPANRTGPLFAAFPYPTKISPEAIALFIAAHTKPGDTVFDGFAGSGTTGLGTLLCENPSAELRAEACRLGLSVQWGPRNAVLYEVGALGAFISRTLTNPPSPKAFRKAAEEILQIVTDEEGWLYKARDLAGRKGLIRYIIWSDCLQCPACRKEVTLWDGCVSREPAKIASQFTCPSCAHEVPLDEVERLTEIISDEILGTQQIIKKRRPVWLYGITGKNSWSRPIIKGDQKLIDEINDTSLPLTVPKAEIPWGDLYRSGYHQGITHLHHFYTRRNLIIFAKLWERTGSYAKQMRDALRFWLLSYNAAHATIMTRVVAKSGQKEFALTSAQSGVLYVSGLPVEKNLLFGLRRKLSTIASAFEVIYGSQGRIEVRQRSSCAIDLQDCSVDYVFTDPPFGGNIPYAEVNFINEAWLGRFTDRKDEAIVSKSQNKGLPDYQQLLTTALTEIRRILKPEGKATLVFHSASAAVWHALQAAYTDAEFSVEYAGVLNKTQGSFKQVTTNGAVRGDPVLMLGKMTTSEAENVDCAWTVAARLWQKALKTHDPAELSAQRLYSRLVTHYLSKHQQVPIDADSYYRWHATQPEMGGVAGACG